MADGLFKKDWYDNNVIPIINTWIIIKYVTLLYNWDFSYDLIRIELNIKLFISSLYKNNKICKILSPTDSSDAKFLKIYPALRVNRRSKS